MSNKVTKHFGCPKIDFFDDRIITQLQNYVSWSCDPDDAKAVNAFFLTDCSKKLSYIFPSFGQLGKVTSKIWRKKAHCIVIIPK